MENIKIPVGRSGFADIRMNNYYFADKSGLIEELLKTDATQVTLITRPRRFGKTLNMSMLSEFFDIRKDSKALFKGLAIAENEELCTKWMNQYPTLFLTFKDIGGNTFENAYGLLETVISNLCKSHEYLTKSEVVNENDKLVFLELSLGNARKKDLQTSIALLIRMMQAYYGKPVILLVDEYDVPIAKASGNRGEKEDYYEQMMEVICPLISTAIKDNDSLKFAVFTGCLRIAKESIFTGTNNFVSDTISDTRLNEYFGFTQAEVNVLLEKTKLMDHIDEIKKWYNGYQFGDFDIYCPWDVMNYVNNLIMNPKAEPKSYWENTSDNAIIRSFLERTQFDVNEKFEELLAGKYILEPIEETLTYDVLESSEENLWTLLYFTGYLTTIQIEEKPPFGLFALKIPNAEVMDIFRKSVKSWFYDHASMSDRSKLFFALWNGEAETLTNLLSDLLFDTISYHDYRESFYHAFLVGLVSNAGYRVESNYENGLGRSDIVVKDRRNRRAFIIEAKWTESEQNLDKVCEQAMRQIEERQYVRKIERMGYKTVVPFAMAFWKKQCLVKVKKE